MTMTMETSKRILKAASVYNFVTGGLVLVLGILGFAGVGAAAAFPEALGDGGTVTVGMLAGGSVILLVIGVISLIEGACDRNAAKDPSKVLPAWYFSIIMLVMEVIAMIIGIVNRTDIIAHGIGFVFAAVIFSAANSMRKEAGF